MSQTAQTFKNHARFFPMFHFFVAPVLLLNVINTLRHVWRAPNEGSVFNAVVAVALLTLALAARLMALTVQDRVIRLEMRLRLHEVLPAEMRNRVHELTPKQLIALRFASDAELPSLVRDVLAGTLANQKAIKQRVKDWQGDYLRA